jgi:peptide/nickel transport system permease protein
MTNAAAPASTRRFAWPAASVVIAGSMLALVLAFVLLGPLLPGYDPLRQNLMDRNLGMFTTGRSGAFYVLGTDMLGRDLLSRLVQGGQLSVTIAFSATVLAALLGTALGVAAGYFGGAVDAVINGICDLLLAVPRILFFIALFAVITPSVLNLVLVLALTTWAIFARVVRAMTLSLREREFVQVAHTLGAPALWTLRRHILPHVAGKVVILASIELGTMIMLEAALSYLGLGVQPPNASWGLMINQAQAHIGTNPKLVILPGIAIFLLVAGTNFISQAFTGESRRTDAGSGV